MKKTLKFILSLTAFAMVAGAGVGLVTGLDRNQVAQRVDAADYSNTIRVYINQTWGGVEQNKVSLDGVTYYDAKSTSNPPDTGDQGCTLYYDFISNSSASSIRYYFTQGVDFHPTNQPPKEEWDVTNNYIKLNSGNFEPGKYYKIDSIAYSHEYDDHTQKFFSYSVAELGELPNTKYTLSWDANGGEIKTPTSNYTVAGQYAEGTPLTAPTEVYKNGYKFTGWNPTVPATMPANNVTFVAQYEQATLRTIYLNISDDTLNRMGSNMSIKANISLNQSDSTWINVDMTRLSNTINGEPVYKAQFYDYLDYVNKIQFLYYSGDTYKGEDNAITQWTPTSDVDNKMYYRESSSPTWGDYTFDAFIKYSTLFVDFTQWNSDGATLRAYSSQGELSVSSTLVDGKYYLVTVPSETTWVKFDRCSPDGKTMWNYTTKQWNFNDAGNECVIKECASPSQTEWKMHKITVTYVVGQWSTGVDKSFEVTASLPYKVLTYTDLGFGIHPGFYLETFYAKVNGYNIGDYQPGSTIDAMFMTSNVTIYSTYAFRYKTYIFDNGIPVANINFNKDSIAEGPNHSAIGTIQGGYTFKNGYIIRAADLMHTESLQFLTNVSVSDKSDGKWNYNTSTGITTCLETEETHFSVQLTVFENGSAEWLFKYYDDETIAHKFAITFNTKFCAICELTQYGQGDVNAIKALWTQIQGKSSVKGEVYWDDMTGGARAMFVFNPETDDKAVLECIAKYKYILEKYYVSLDLGDFMNLYGGNVPARQYSFANSVFTDFTDGSSNNPTLIILISCVVTGLAIGGYFLLRKRKED